MINIEKVTIKQTKKGDDYKSVKLDDGRYINIWNNDFDYEKVADGITLDRGLEQRGDFWNLLAPGATEMSEVKQKPHFGKGDLDTKLNVLYEGVRQIMDHLGIETKAVEEKQDVIEYPEEEINPEDIPF